MLEPAVTESRRRLMQSVRRQNTSPELVVRRLLHRLGFRFRLHPKLPGTPDLILPRYRVAIFVHGCFWHRHQGCRYATTPKTRTDFWLKKFAANEERDLRKTEALRSLGWNVLTIWECQTRNLPALETQFHRSLESRR